MKTLQNSSIELEADNLLKSGNYLETLTSFIKSTGVAQIENHVVLAYLAAMNTLRQERDRRISVLFTGQTGSGKSVALNLVTELLPTRHVVSMDNATLAYWKRVGETLTGKVVITHELSNWFSDASVSNFIKSLITEGRATVCMVETNEEGIREPVEFKIDCVFSIIGASTQECLVRLLQHQENEIRSRFLEIPMPENKEYTQAAVLAAMYRKGNVRLQDTDYGLLCVLRTGAELAMGEPVPLPVTGLLEAISTSLDMSNPLVVRLASQLVTLLETVTILMGKKTIDLGVYEYLHPLLASTFRSTLTINSDAIRNRFEVLVRHLMVENEITDVSSLTFKYSAVRAALNLSENTVAAALKKWTANNWVEKLEGYKGYKFTKKGKKVLEDITNNTPSFPDVLPLPETLKERISSTLLHCYSTNCSTNLEKVEKAETYTQ